VKNSCALPFYGRLFKEPDESGNYGVIIIEGLTKLPTKVGHYDSIANLLAY
jgi:hypothetical protein